MEYIYQQVARQIPVWADVDVCVVGGGNAGWIAALAAARQGAHVLLIERNPALGGTSSAGFVGPWTGFHNRRGQQVIAGFAEEVVGRLKAIGGSTGHLPDTVGFAGSITPFDPHDVKRLAFQMVQENNIELLLYSTVSDVVLDGSRITAVILSNRSGQYAARARTFIDATGDGDLAVRAGAPWEQGRAGDCGTQPMTTIFRMGGVDLAAVREFMCANPSEFHSDTTFGPNDEWPISGVSGFFGAWQRAVEAGGVTIPRDRFLFFVGIRPGEVTINTGRVIGQDGTDERALTAAEITGRAQVYELAAALNRYVPGFQDAYVADVASQIGVRETRRILGEYVLSKDDILRSRGFDDAVCQNAYPIDIHDPYGQGLVDGGQPQGEFYQIPYRCLLPLCTTNLLVTGRCISVDHEAFGSTRVTAPCMALGQAAGTAGALAVRTGGEVRSVDTDQLQTQLRSDGALIDETGQPLF